MKDIKRNRATKKEKEEEKERKTEKERGPPETAFLPFLVSCIGFRFSELVSDLGRSSISS